MRFVLAGLGLALAVLAAGFFAVGSGDRVSAQDQSVTVTMGAGRDASQTGTATLTAQGSQTQVVVNIQPGGAGVAQPGHIHQGSCPGVGAVAFPLTNVVDGTSTTVVNASLDSLRTGGYSINIHQDGTQAGLGVYVSCGGIPAAAQTTPAATASPAAAPVAGGGPPASSNSSFAWWYVLIAIGAVALASGGALALRLRSIR